MNNNKDVSKKNLLLIKSKTFKGELIPECECDKKKSLYRDFISRVNSNPLRISLPFRRDKDGSEREKKITMEIWKKKERERESARGRRAEEESERETEMGNEKDRAVIIIAEFAFRMQTDQGHGA